MSKETAQGVLSLVLRSYKSKLKRAQAAKNEAEIKRIKAKIADVKRQLNQLK